MWKIKITAIILSVVMFLTFTPSSVMKTMADGIKNIELSDSDVSERLNDETGVTNIEIGDYTDSFISKELTEKRTEHSKQFLLENGTVMQQRFTVPVHYKDGKSFKEIDNALDLKTTATGENYYENRANSFNVKLFENIGKNATFYIENGDYGMEFTINSKNGEEVLSSKAAVEKPVETAQTATVAKLGTTDAVNYASVKTKDPIQPNTGLSQLTYEKVFNNVDFEYSVDSLGVKENIVVHSPMQSYDFCFTVKARGLNLILQSSGEITAYNGDGEAVFVIPAPNMSDEAGNYSEAVSYELTEKADGEYTLSIIPDKEWLNDDSRVFPVKIDPAVATVERKTANGLTLYANNAAAAEYNQSRIKFGKISSKYCDGFMAFPNENNQFYYAGHQLVCSKLKYYIRSVGANAAGTTTYSVRAMSASAPLKDIKSEDELPLDVEKPILLNGTIKSTKVLFFNASHEARWEETYFDPEFFNDYPDMLFMWECKSTNDNQHGEVDVRSGNLPSVINYYVTTAGIKEDLPYEQFGYNGGTASVNLINGDLTATFTALSIDVAQNPLSLQLVYNDNYDDIMSEFGLHNMFGRNIKINFQQALTTDSNVLRYVDGDGSIETLTKGKTAYYSIDKSLIYSLGVLNVNTNTELGFQIEKLYECCDTSDVSDPKTMYRVYYSGEKITEIAGYTSNVKTHYITFTYSGERVSYAQSFIATSAAGNSFQNLARCDFTYDSDGNLKEITNYNSGNKKFVFEYQDEKLRGLVDFDRNGYTFERTYYASTDPVRMASVAAVYGERALYGHYLNNSDGYVFFSSPDKNYTLLRYYNAEGNKTGERNVSRRFGKGFTSEWSVNDKNETIITTSVASLTGDPRDCLTYVKTEYAAEENHNTTLSGSNKKTIVAGGSLNGTILENHGISGKTGRQYCLSLKIESAATSFAEVYVAGAKKGTVCFNGETNAYYIIPVDYCATNAATAIRIKNTGLNDIFVSNVSYGYFTSIQTSKEIHGSGLLNYVTSIAVLTDDDRRIINCDYFGRPKTITTIDYSVNPTETRIYTYTYEKAADKYDLTRLKSVSDGTNEAEYSYNTTSSGEQQTTVLTRKTPVPVTKTVTSTGGALGWLYQTKTQNGITVKTEYGIKGGNVRPYRITEGNNVTEYTYNYDGNITSIKVNGIITHQTGYDSNGKEIGYYIGGSEQYSLVRDSSLYGLITGINHNGSRMLTFAYNGGGNIDSVTYANGARENYNYNIKTLQSVELRDSETSPATLITYGYTGNDVTSVTQSVNGVTQLSYLFAEADYMNTITVSGDVNARYVYDYNQATGRLKQRTAFLDNDKHEIEEHFTYDKYGALKSIGNVGFNAIYAYDDYDRVSSLTYYANGANRITQQYEYDTVTEGTVTYQTGRIKKITNSANQTQTYAYNNRGYVKTYHNSQNSDSYTYGYDGAGRLISDGKYTYAYDGYNNITKKQTGVSSVTFGYDTKKKTQLKSVSENGNTKYFGYDAMGNIITYKGSTATDTQNLYWTRGNMLASGSIKDGVTFSYKYGADNVRYSKTVNGVETVYFWDDGLLVAEKTGDRLIQYCYDANGIAGMRYGDAYYYFEKNLFGDVIRVYDAVSSVVAEFKYDSYGNVISESGAFASEIKFRYRGYYYDSETGFYYLQSRYYDPSICRFISADQYELVLSLSKIPGQINLYAYCNNNPVMFTDESGEGIIGILALILGLAGAAIGGSYFGVAAYKAGYTGLDLAGEIAFGILCGFWAGVLTGLLIGINLPAIATFMSTPISLFNYVSGAGALISVSVTGAQLVAVTAGVATAAGVGILYSKERPGMTNKAPFSWVTKEEGIEAMRKFNKDANKAADYIMSNHREKWGYGPGHDVNVIKKWLDRIIRRLI